MKNQAIIKSQAEMLIENPLLESILDELETNAMESAINSKFDDDETKRFCINEIRAIRNLRQKLVELTKARLEMVVTGNVA